MEGDKKSKIKSILGIIVTILVILLYISWTYGITVKTNNEGQTECYNIYGKRVGC